MVKIIPEKRFYTGKGRYVVLTPAIKDYSLKELKLIEAYKKAKLSPSNRAREAAGTVSAGASEIARQTKNYLTSEDAKTKARGFIHTLNQAFK